MESPENDEDRLKYLWNQCNSREYEGDGDSKIKVYHATTEENRKAIIASNEFHLPTRKYAIENGLKVGAAVYFGLNPKYCLSEAHNTESNKGKNIVLLEVTVSLGRCIDLGDYDVGMDTLGQEDWEWMTERLSAEEGQRFGFDAICINNGSYCQEFALYRPKEQILSIEAYDIDSEATSWCNLL
jgi:hypothetical protein